MQRYASRLVLELRGLSRREGETLRDASCSCKNGWEGYEVMTYRIGHWQIYTSQTLQGKDLNQEVRYGDSKPMQTPETKKHLFNIREVIVCSGMSQTLV